MQSRKSMKKTGECGYITYKLNKMDKLRQELINSWWTTEPDSIDLSAQSELHEADMRPRQWCKWHHGTNRLTSVTITVSPPQSPVTNCRRECIGLKSTTSPRHNCLRCLAPVTASQDPISLCSNSSTGFLSNTSTLTDSSSFLHRSTTIMMLFASAVLPILTLWRPLLPCGYSYKASRARPG